MLASAEIGKNAKMILQCVFSKIYILVISDSLEGEVAQQAPVPIPMETSPGTPQGTPG